MVGGVGQEGSVGLVEEGRAAAVALGEDDFVEELDGGVLRARRLAFVDEFVESLRLAEHVHVLAVAVWYALKELVHVEMVGHPGFAPLAGRRVQEAAIGVEEGGEAADEGGADLVRAEGNGADYGDSSKASEVDVDATA